MRRRFILYQPIAALVAVACRPARGTVLSGDEGTIIASILRDSCDQPMTSYKHILMSRGREIYAVSACGKNYRFVCKGEVTGCSGFGLAANPIDTVCCADLDGPRRRRDILCFARTEPLEDKRVIPRDDIPDQCPDI
jgi:hypothetical protein